MDRPVKTVGPVPLSLQDAKARFSEVVAAAMRGRVQHVTRRGKPAVVIIGAEEFERMAKATRPGPAGFIDYLRSMPSRNGETPLPRQRLQLRPRDIDLTP